MKTFLQYLAEQNSVDVDAYHGTGSQFQKFEASKARVRNDYFGGGVGYFTDHPDVAHTYAKSMAKTSGTGTPHVFHTKLKMKNVFDVDHEFTGDKLKDILPRDVEGFARGAGMLKFGDDKYKVLHDLKAGKTVMKGHHVFKGLSSGGVNSAQARDHLISKGYDGLRYNGGENMDAQKHNVYIPYHPDSIDIKHVEKLPKITVKKKLTTH